MLNLETFVKLIGGPGIEKNCFKSKHSAVQLRKKKKVLASKKKKKKLLKMLDRSVMRKLL